MRNSWTCSAGVLVFAAAILPAAAQGPVSSTGRWLETAEGEVISWQASDLTYDRHRDCLWAISDQNGRARPRGQEREIGPAKFLLRIELRDGQPVAQVVEIRFDRRDFEALRGAVVPPNEFALGLDYEGLVADPQHADVFYACTEGTRPLLMRLEYRPEAEGRGRAFVTNVVRISRLGNHDDRDPSNARWEGLTMDRDGTRFFLATERDDDRRPRLYSVGVRSFLEAESLGVDPESRVSTTAIEGPDLRGAILSGLAHLPDRQDPDHPGYLLALNRNPEEKIFVVNLAEPSAAVRVVGLDLTAPPGRDTAATVRTNGMSPEGLAVDEERGRAWLINDPISESGGRPIYRPLDPSQADDLSKFDRLIPMVFELDLAPLRSPTVRRNSGRF